MPRPADPERSARILAAARALFFQRQYEQTTMADIAAAADMGVGSLYVYFPTKETIALTLVEHYFAELHEAIVPPLHDLAGAQAITQTIVAGLASAQRNIDVVALCRLIPIQCLLPERQRLLAAIEHAVAHQIGQGHFLPLDPIFVTQWINAQIEWVIIHCLVERTGSIAAYQHQLTEVIVRAIVSPPTTPSP